MNKSLAKIRIEVIDKLIKKYKSDEELNRLLSNGFIPEAITNEYTSELEALMNKQDDFPADTDLELSQYGNFFALHKDRIIGEEKPGSGFLNPVITKGNISDLDKIPYSIPVKMTGPAPKKTTTNPPPSQKQSSMEENSASQSIADKLREATEFYMAALSTPEEERSAAQQAIIDQMSGVFNATSKAAPKAKKTEPAPKPDPTPEPTPEPEPKKETELDKIKKIASQSGGRISVVSMAPPKFTSESAAEKAENEIFDIKITEALAAKPDPEQDKGPELLSIKESLRLYNENISEAEIKAWVYYKRLYGNPMFGYEDYFLTAAGANKSKLVIAKESVHLKDNHFRDIKMVPKGTVIGVKTKFKNEYDKETYIVVKSEQNELLYVALSKVEEQDSFDAVADEELRELVKQKGLCYKNGEFVPVPYYTFGNIYEIRDELIGTFNKETNKYEGGYYDELLKTFGEEVALWHKELIETAIKLKGEYAFNNPEKSKRPFLSKENPLSEEVRVTELNEISGVNFEEIFKETRTRRQRWDKYDHSTAYSLFDAFTYWFKITVTDTMLTNTTKSDITRYYINNQNMPSGEGEGLSEKEKDAVKLNAKIEGEFWYQEFLNTCLTYEDMLKLNYLFNKQYNSFSKINLSKIPVAFEANARIFNIPSFRLKPVQRDGLAFISATGSGCFAYEVGFGKTLCAIHTLAAVLKEGKVKRPLVAMPKPVYNNWIREMFGFWTDGKEKRFEEFAGSKFVNGALTGTRYKLNLWYNLSDKIGAENKQLDPYTITIVTYQGLEKIGFSTSLREDFASELNKIIGKQNMGATSERKKAQAEQDIYSRIGIAESDTVVDIDTCGFDYLVIDEAHNFKNVFGSVKLDKEQNDIWKIPNKVSTRRAIKAFVLALYLQKKYNGNVLLLTATPFTNSPMEIFSMMSLIGYQNLKKYGIENIHTFLSMFIETISEFTVDSLNNIKVDTVIKSFKNKNILRDILYRHFDYQDNPKLAGIKRPCKINFPNKKYNINTFLEMSEFQLEGQRIVRIEAASYDRKQNPGAMGRALNLAKNNALSPFLVPGIERYETIEELVNESPKIKYAIECINSIKEYHDSKNQEMSGQVIYANRGIDLFSDIKEALEQRCNFKRNISFGDEEVDEVEIIKSTTSDKDADRKEVVKDAFNKGYVKVIIGTGTIKEGVNLQERGTALYNLDLDWNPTDFRQLEGRIHRQGNQFRYCRIAVPFVQNTLDSFINQKLDEKSKRIATIWDKTNDVNTLEEDNFVDPMEIKFALIDDEEQLVKMKTEQDGKGYSKKLEIAQDKLEGMLKVERAVNDFEEYKKDNEEQISDTLTRHEKYIVLLDKFKKSHPDMTKKEMEGIKDLEVKVQENIVLLQAYQKGDVTSMFDCYRNLQKRSYEFKFDEETYDFKKLCNFGLSYHAEGYEYEGLSRMNTGDFPHMISKYSEIKKFERMTLQAYGLTINDDFSLIKKTFQTEVDTIKDAVEFLKTAQYTDSVLTEIKQELKKRSEQRGTIEDRVAAFASFNYLLSYPFIEQEADNCELATTEADHSFNVEDQDVPEEYAPVTTEEVFAVSSKFKVTKQKIKYAKPEDKATKLIPEVKFFLPQFQEKIIRTNEEFEDVRVRLNDIIPKMPWSYQTEGVPTKDKIVYLHYFYGNQDYYILEKDRGDGKDPSPGVQLQAFGAVDLGDGPEFGYVSINEILESNKVELDLYFTPKKWSEVIGESAEENEDLTHLLNDEEEEVVAAPASIPEPKTWNEKYLETIRNPKHPRHKEYLEGKNSKEGDQYKYNAATPEGESMAQAWLAGAKEREVVVAPANKQNINWQEVHDVAQIMLSEPMSASEQVEWADLLFEANQNLKNQ